MLAQAPTFSKVPADVPAEAFPGPTRGRFELGHNRKRRRSGGAEVVWIVGPVGAGASGLAHGLTFLARR